MRADYKVPLKMTRINHELAIRAMGQRLHSIFNLPRVVTTHKYEKTLY